MQLSVLNTEGAVVGKTEASDMVFGAPVNQDLLHQALVYYQANQRQGSSNTLTRGNVSGGGRKPFAQKGTGRARQGSTRSPIQRHGGVVFGPHPRSYRQRMPKRMRRQAIRTALSAKVASERIYVVKDLDGIEPKTRAMAGVMQALGVTGSALVVMRAPGVEVTRTVRNLPRTKAVRADLLNVLDLARFDALVITPEAVQRADELWSGTERIRKEPLAPVERAAAPAPRRRAAPKAPVAEAPSAAEAPVADAVAEPAVAVPAEAAPSETEAKPKRATTRRAAPAKKPAGTAKAAAKAPAKKPASTAAAKKPAAKKPAAAKPKAAPKPRARTGETSGS